MRHPNKKAADMTIQELASYIDYSVLKPEFTEQEIIDLTVDGVKLECATICINPGYLALCKPYVEGTKTKLAPCCDFPFGTSSTDSKVAQAKEILKYKDVIGEIDMVANFGLIRSHEWEKVTADIKAVVDTAHAEGIEVKVIFETDALTVDEVKQACHCAMDAGVDFVKTSTGFLTGHDNVGATPEIIQVMMDEVGETCKVKGSGCIRTREHFLKLIDMGIDRMGVGYKSVPVVLGLDK